MLTVSTYIHMYISYDCYYLMKVPLCLQLNFNLYACVYLCKIAPQVQIPIVLMQSNVNATLHPMLQMEVVNTVNQYVLSVSSNCLAQYAADQMFIGSTPSQYVCAFQSMLLCCSNTYTQMLLLFIAFQLLKQLLYNVCDQEFYLNVK